MTKKLLPFLFAAMLCVLPPSAAGRQFASVGANVAAHASATATSESAAASYELTDADREAFQLAQQSSDPDLGEQRGGWVGLVLVILIIVLIVVLVD